MLTGFAAPRPSASAKRDFSRITVAGVIGARTGLAQAALGLARRLASMGADVATFDLAPAFMSSEASAGLQAAGPQTVEPARGREGAMIIVINAPFLPLALTHLGRRRARGRYLVAHWSWELEELPADWRHGFDRTHEIWVSSEFMARPIRERSRRPVHVVPPTPADLALTAPPPEAAADRPFTVLTMFDMGSSFERKNPLAAIAAFREAFPNPGAARLIVKMSHGDAFEPGRRAILDAIAGAADISLLTETLDREATIALIANCDVLLSTHRSEGFGLPLFEAMLLERAVVATGWSANTEFMTAENSVLLPYRLIPAIDPQETYTLAGAQWADADVAAATQALRDLAADPIRRRALGAAARRDALAFIARHDQALRTLIGR